jgi:hypothetical protein
MIELVMLYNSREEKDDTIWVGKKPSREIEILLNKNAILFKSRSKNNNKIIRVDKFKIIK